MKYCASLKLAGGGWRLPSKDELLYHGVPGHAGCCRRHAKKVHSSLRHVRGAHHERQTAARSTRPMRAMREKSLSSDHRLQPLSAAMAAIKRSANPKR